MAQTTLISDLQTNATEIIGALDEQSGPAFITQHGEAKAVLLDVDTYEQTQETLALLKLLALGEQQVRDGQVQPLDDTLAAAKAGQLLD